MRVQIPVDFTEDEIAVTANIFFWHFANDLGAFINKFMTERDGNAWLQDLKTNDVNYRTFNIKDPAALLKDLAKFGGSKLRPAIHSKVERGFLKEYYEDLDALLGERNAWYHRQVQETKEELLDLIKTILRASIRLNLKIVEDCEAVKDVILNGHKPAVTPAQAATKAEPAPVPSAVPAPATAVDTAVIAVIAPEPIEVAPTVVAKDQEIEQAQAELVADIIEIAGNETSQIGDEVSEKLLSHSYVLHTTGEIRNRLSEELLSDVNPESATALGSFLISRKPSGGRIRITEEGVLCAFFDDKWGYLARVKSEDWFPDHLHNKTEKK
jgi:hypothetical protein